MSGIELSSDMEWNANTVNIVANGFKRIWMLRRLKSMGTEVPELKDVFIKQIRSVLELAVPVWHCSLTLADRANIERVQKAALHVMLGDKYESYSRALKLTGLETLESRRIKLCSKFASKSMKHPKHSNWYKVNTKVTNTRQQQPKFRPVVSRTVRFSRSPISFLTDILNKKYSKQK